MKYRLEKLVNGQWYEEGTYPEGNYVEHMVKAAFVLGKYGNYDIEDIRVTVLKDESKD